MGFERWANLPPSEFRLQSFGHAAVSEDGILDIKLIGIDGAIKFEKTLTPETLPPVPAPTPDAPTEDSAPTGDDDSGSATHLLSLQCLSLFGAVAVTIPFLLA